MSSNLHPDRLKVGVAYWVDFSYPDCDVFERCRGTFDGMIVRNNTLYLRFRLKGNHFEVRWKSVRAVQEIKSAKE